jgi:hypothetical protein
VSANKRSEKQATSKPPSNAAGQRGRVAWEDRLSELADYREVHGHCNVRKSYSENSKLANWVATQRSNYKLYREGKTSHMTPSRIKELDSMGFDWESRASSRDDRHGASWEDRLSELADYCEIFGH